MITAQNIINTLALAPLPLEGGYYAETYRSAFGTAIYYLLTPDSYAAMHRLPGDEIFHFYLGIRSRCCNCGRTERERS
jgi:predicted cupin superfamily sugar epimerase